MCWVEQNLNNAIFCILTPERFFYSFFLLNEKKFLDLFRGWEKHSIKYLPLFELYDTYLILKNLKKMKFLKQFAIH